MEARRVTALSTERPSQISDCTTSADPPEVPAVRGLLGAAALCGLCLLSEKSKDKRDTKSFLLNHLSFVQSVFLFSKPFRDFAKKWDRKEKVIVPFNCK